MVKIIMHGCNGHMGQVISGLVAQDPDAEIVAGIDVADQGKNSYPVYTDMKECQVEADALIDFLFCESDRCTSGLLCRKRKLPVVLCTTGLSEEQLAKVEETAKKVAVAEISRYVPGYQYSPETDPGRSEGSGHSRLRYGDRRETSSSETGCTKRNSPGTGRQLE